MVNKFDKDYEDILACSHIFLFDESLKGNEFLNVSTINPKVCSIGFLNRCQSMGLWN